MHAEFGEDGFQVLGDRPAADEEAGCYLAIRAAIDEVQQHHVLTLGQAVARCKGRVRARPGRNRRDRPESRLHRRKGSKIVAVPPLPDAGRGFLAEDVDGKLRYDRDGLSYW